MRPRKIEHLSQVIGTRVAHGEGSLAAPVFSVAPGPFGVPCALSQADLEADQALLQAAASLGFPVPGW